MRIGLVGTVYDGEPVGMMTCCDLSVSSITYALGKMKAAGYTPLRLEIPRAYRFLAEHCLDSMGAIPYVPIVEWVPREGDTERDAHGWILYGVPTHFVLPEAETCPSQAQN